MIAQGFHEMQRVCQRVLLRIQRRRAEEALRKSEVTLGELGWQQADYGPELAPVIERLQQIEQEELGLLNQSAERAHEIRECEKALEAAKLELDTRLAEIGKATAPLQAALTQAQAAYDAADRICHAVDANEREARAAVEEAEKGLTSLMAASEEKNFLTRRLELIDRKTQARNRLEELGRERAEALPRRATAARELERLRTELDHWQSQAAEARARFGAHEKELATKTAAVRQTKQQLEKGVDSMEKRKAECFLEVGRVLANEGIGPMNQPEALTNVYAAREALFSLEQRHAESVAATQAMPQQLRNATYGIVTMLAVAILLSFLFLL